MAAVGGGALIILLLVDFPQRHLDIVNSKVLTRIGIEIDLTKKGSRELRALIREVVNIYGLNGLGNNIVNLLLWFLH